MGKNDNKQLYSLLCGKLLGDGTLNLTRGKARLQFRHTKKDEQYVIDQLQLFSQYLCFGKKNPTEYTYLDKRTNKTYATIICQSKTDPRLTEISKIWYLENRLKILPKHFIKQYLNEIALAIWYQDDGSLKNHRRIILSTESFSKEENLFLRQLLLERFHINSSIDTQNRLDISSRINVELFLSYVTPHLSPVMKRKRLNSYYEELSKATDSLLKGKKDYFLLTKRTTIYIPLEIKRLLQSSKNPSKQLNQMLSINRELIEIVHYSYRQQRILQVKKEDIFNHEKVPYTIYLSEHHYKGLKLLKKWTGIEVSEYVLLLIINNPKFISSNI